MTDNKQDFAKFKYIHVLPATSQSICDNLQMSTILFRQYKSSDLLERDYYLVYVTNLKFPSRANYLNVENC